MDVRGGSAVDPKTEQFGSAVVAARVHQLLALVDQREVEVGNEDALAGMERLAQKGSVGCHDRGETAARDRADAAAGVLHDLRLLIGVQPGGRADDEASRL